MAERGKILESIALGDVGKIRMYLWLVFARSHDRRHSALLSYGHFRGAINAARVTAQRSRQPSQVRVCCPCGVVACREWISCTTSWPRVRILQWGCAKVMRRAWRLHKWWYRTGWNDGDKVSDLFEVTCRNRVGRGELGAEAKRPLVMSLTSFRPRRLHYDSKNGCENMNAQSMGCTDS